MLDWLWKFQAEEQENRHQPSWASSFAEQNPTGASTLLAPTSTHQQMLLSLLGEATSDWLMGEGVGKWRGVRGRGKEMGQYPPFFILTSPLLIVMPFALRGWNGIRRHFPLLGLSEILVKGQKPRNEGAVSGQITACYSHDAYWTGICWHGNFKISLSPR